MAVATNSRQQKRLLKQVGQSLEKNGLLTALNITGLQLGHDEIYYTFGDTSNLQEYKTEHYKVFTNTSNVDLLLKNIALLYDALAAKRDLTEALLHQYRESALMLRTATTLAGTINKTNIAEKLLSCFPRVESGLVLQDGHILAKIGDNLASIADTHHYITDLTKPDMGMINNNETKCYFVYVPLKTNRPHQLFLWRKTPFSSVDLQQATTFAAIAAAALDNAQRHRIQQNLSRYMPATAIDQITDTAPDLLTGSEQQATILFADLRGFTKLTDALGARQTVSLLNAWFSMVVKITNKHGGVIDKFLGDGLLAVYGVPGWEKHFVMEAVTTAADLEEAVKIVSEKTGHDLNVGIGIGTGTVISGNIGAADRLDFTVIGSPVNRAAKQQLLSKSGDHNIILDVKTFNALPIEFQQHCTEIAPQKYGYKRLS